MSIRVVAVDDHPLILQIVVDILNAQPDIEVVGQASHGNQLLQLVRETQPDVVVLDIGMTGETFEPVQAVRQLHQAHPNVEVLVLTGYDDEFAMLALTETGARGYLLKSDDLTLDLGQAVRKVHRGERCYSSAVIDTVLAGRYPDDQLDEQEQIVLHLVSQGLVNERIGNVLGLSERRVRNIMTSIYAKLRIQEQVGVNPRVAAVRKGLELGLVS